MIKITKKFTALVLSLALAFSAFCCFSYAAESFTFALYVNGQSSAKVDKDGEAAVTMKIEASEAYTLYSMQDYIKFDSEYFQLDEDSISVKQVASLGEYVDLFSHTPILTSGAYDRVFVNRASLSGVSLSADEIIITFTLKPLKQGTTQITHYRTEMLDSSNSRYSVNEENAEVVIGSFSDSDTTEETTQSTTEETTQTTTELAAETETASIETTQTTTETTTITETTTQSAASSSSSSGGGGGGGSSIRTITLVINGEETTVTVKSGNALSRPDDPVLEGYTFEGWYTDMAYVTEYDFSKAVTGSFTLYAKMTESENAEESDASDASKAETPADEEAKSSIYSDVSADDWFYEAVGFVTEKGIMVGISEDEFAPDMPLTRAMFVTVLHRIEGSPEESEEPTFSDISESDWYYEAVKWGQKNNIIYGYSNEEYAPSDKITREQTAAIIYRYAAYKGINTETDGEADYSDSQSITSYAKPAVKWISDKGFMQGDADGGFRPLSNASRAETAQVVMNVVENLSKFKL